jgi:hypothetical protein
MNWLNDYHLPIPNHCARRAAMRFVLVSVVFLLNAAHSRADGPQANLVADASFERPAQGSPLPAGWNGDPQVYRREAGAGRSGSAALAFVNRDPERYCLASQQIPLQPGRKYRLSGWVKTRQIVGEDSGATFCIEWIDKAGKWLGGTYPNGVKGTRDWTEITTVVRIPEEAGVCTLSCYVRQGMTGSAWFDDLELVRIADPPLESVLVSPVYRGRITGEGPATIRAVVRLDLRDYDLRPQAVRVRGRLSRQPEGKVYGQLERQPSGDRRTAGPIVLEFPASRLPVGRYRLDVELIDPEGKTLGAAGHVVVREGESRRPTCAIDEHRRLLIDGKPFFPLGMYWGGIDAADLAIYAQSKFNCLMPYGSPDRWQMDLAGKHGLKVIYSIKDWYAGSEWCPGEIRTVGDEEQAVRARVREYRDHPALLAWYLNDELPLQYLPQLEAHQRWVAETDPDHPTWVVLYQFNEVAAYLRSFDVIGTDPYPIGHHPASMAAQWTAETFRQVAQARPMWQVPQVHSWANYAKTDAERRKSHTPTLAEVRSMAWQCIAEGATGLVFYSWMDLKRNPDVPFAVQWAGLTRLAAEIDRMAPILLSIEPVAGVTIDDGRRPAWLHVLVRRWRGKLYLIAVNDGDGEGSVKFRLSGAVRAVRELGGDRVLDPEAGGFQDHLPRLAVRRYEVVMGE